jgi:hypothetical protein
METYIVTLTAEEHRCQCCGEMADTLFCHDCAHESGIRAASPAPSEGGPPANVT